jgi:hypothetical protein
VGRVRRARRMVRKIVVMALAAAFMGGLALAAETPAEKPKAEKAEKTSGASKAVMGLEKRITDMEAELKATTEAELKKAGEAALAVEKQMLDLSKKGEDAAAKTLAAEKRLALRTYDLMKSKKALSEELAKAEGAAKAQIEKAIKATEKELGLEKQLDAKMAEKKAAGKDEAKVKAAEEAIKEVRKQISEAQAEANAAKDASAPKKAEKMEKTEKAAEKK